MAENSKVEIDRQRLLQAQQGGKLAKLATYVRLSGPGWLQSAITLGGGSLSASLYLGVLAGFSFLWLQPLAMILGIIMLSAIAYVTTSTGERPFPAINRHVSPVLGWAWLLASLSANMFWCLPQYSLATGVLQLNLLPDLVGPGSAMGLGNGKVLIAIAILIFTTAITWAYDSGSWGIKLYELLLKLMVASIVVCFFGVIYAIRSEVDWGSLLAGFVPDFSKLFEPSDEFLVLLKDSAYAQQWSSIIVSQQRDVMIGAAATAVGINMTFLFPYSMLSKGWTKEFRGLAIFDLATGMLIPFMLATSCVVIAAANQFHTEPVAGFLGETDEAGALIVAPEKDQAIFNKLMTPILEEELKEAGEQMPEDANVLGKRIGALPESDRRIAAMLVERDVFDLAKALSPLTGNRVANIVFGLGVLGMALSTITILMLISGFCVCEALGLPNTGWRHRFGTLAAATGVLGPFVWTQAAPLLAVYVSAFGLMLLPIAYWAFFFLMNRPALLKENMPTGGRRVMWNSLMILSAGIATAASIYSVHKKLGNGGLIAMAALVIIGLIVQLLTAGSRGERAGSE